LLLGDVSWHVAPVLLLLNRTDIDIIDRTATVEKLRLLTTVFIGTGVLGGLTTLLPIAPLLPAVEPRVCIAVIGGVCCTRAVLPLPFGYEHC
jgi:hydrogenase/urease accessory protein HupE